MSRKAGVLCHSSVQGQIGRYLLEDVFAHGGGEWNQMMFRAPSNPKHSLVGIEHPLVPVSGDKDTTFALGGTNPPVLSHCLLRSHGEIAAGAQSKLCPCREDQGTGGCV